MNLGARAGGQVIIQTSDHLKIHHVLAGGDVRLQASASSAADLDDTILGGSITGDGTVGGDTANPANDIAIGVLGDLILLADGSVGTAINPLRIQIAPLSTLSMNVVDDLYLDQIADTNLDINYTDTTPDTTAFNPASRGFSVTPAEVTQFGYVLSLTSMHLPELISINAAPTAIHDLRVENASAGGAMSIRIVDETGAPDTGDLYVGKVQAGITVDLRAPRDILDLFDDVAAPIVNILTDADADTGNVYLKAGRDIGKGDNYLDVEIWDGEINADLGRNAFINSVRNLNVGSVPGITSTGGNVTLTVHGQTNVGLITAQQGTVKITSDAAIVDRRDDDADNIEARNIDLISLGSFIGSADNHLDVDSSNASPGQVDALALHDIFITETSGHLRVGLVQSLSADVMLVTKLGSGSILDAADDGAADVVGVNIDLIAHGGTIGVAANDLDIDSSNPSTGRLLAEADGSIYITETDAELNVLLARSFGVGGFGGDVRLTVAETSALDEHLNLLASGTSVDGFRTFTEGRIQAAGSVNCAWATTSRLPTRA